MVRGSFGADIMSGKGRVIKMRIESAASAILDTGLLTKKEIMEALFPPKPTDTKTYHCSRCALQTNNVNKVIKHIMKHRHLVLHVEKGWYV